LSGINPNHQAGIRDAPNNSVAALYLLADLSGGADESDTPLATEQARRGMGLQLRGHRRPTRNHRKDDERRVRGMSRRRDGLAPPFHG
jgi:hypothetical protein